MQKKNQPNSYHISVHGLCVWKSEWVWRMFQRKGRERWMGKQPEGLANARWEEKLDWGESVWVVINACGCNQSSVSSQLWDFEQINRFPLWASALKGSWQSNLCTSFQLRKLQSFEASNRVSLSHSFFFSPFFHNSLQCLHSVRALLILLASGSAFEGITFWSRSSSFF